MREVSKDTFFATIAPMNVHPRSERMETIWETPQRAVVGRSTPGYLCEGRKAYFLPALPAAMKGHAEGCGE